MMKRVALKNVHSINEFKNFFEIEQNTNIFLVEISEAPDCNCGFVAEKHLCEHVVYVTTTILGVNEKDSNLCQKQHKKSFVTRLFFPICRDV